MNFIHVIKIFILFGLYSFRWYITRYKHILYGNSRSKKANLRSQICIAWEPLGTVLFFSSTTGLALSWNYFIAIVYFLTFFLSTAERCMTMKEERVVTRLNCTHLVKLKLHKWFLRFFFSNESLTWSSELWVIYSSHAYLQWSDNFKNC